MEPENQQEESPNPAELTQDVTAQSPQPSEGEQALAPCDPSDTKYARVMPETQGGRQRVYFSGHEYSPDEFESLLRRMGLEEKEVKFVMARRDVGNKALREVVESLLGSIIAVDLGFDYEHQHIQKRLSKVRDRIENTDPQQKPMEYALAISEEDKLVKQFAAIGDRSIAMKRIGVRVVTVSAMIRQGGKLKPKSKPGFSSGR